MDSLPQAVPHSSQRVQTLPINIWNKIHHHSCIGGGGALPDEIRGERE